MIGGKGVSPILLIIALLAILIALIFVIGSNKTQTATQCYSDEDCYWCGQECVRIQKYMPPCPYFSHENYECGCVSNKCQKIPTTTAQICNCPEGFVPTSDGTLCMSKCTSLPGQPQCTPPVSPCLLSTTTTTNSSKYVDLNELVKDPSLYVNSYVHLNEGHVVKNVGAFFGDTYYLQSDTGITNFKNLNESSTGIAIVSDKSNLEDLVQYTFNGTAYSYTSPKASYYFEFVIVDGFVRDRGNVVDASRYYLEVVNIGGYFLEPSPLP